MSTTNSPEPNPAPALPWTVGQVAEQLGVTVRTLHHYEKIGLLAPAERTAAGYRLYDAGELQRLQAIVGYRRLGFPLATIADLLAADEITLVDHLRRQRDLITAQVAELTALADTIDTALEVAMTDRPATDAELREMFGDAFDDDYAAEAEARWGETDAWKQSQQRTKGYTKADWAAVKDEQDAVNAALVAALVSGAPATSEVAMDAAEAHRRSIERFYDCSYAMHRGLADMYLADPRFTKTYEDLAPGLAAYVRDAIHANADRHED